MLGGLLAIGMLVSLVSADSIDDAVKRAYEIVFAGAVISPVIAAVGLVLLTTRHSAAYYWVRYGNPRALLWFGLFIALGIAAVAVAASVFGYVAMRIGLVLWFTVPLGAFVRGVGDVCSLRNSRGSTGNYAFCRFIRRALDARVSIG